MLVPSRKLPLPSRGRPRTSWTRVRLGLLDFDSTSRSVFLDKIFFLVSIYLLNTNISF